MNSMTYQRRRGELEVYFDRTAAEAWSRLTSDAPVGRIRATVRAGRERMRNLLLDWLPRDLSGRRILDAGCGTGALAVELARRGGQVTAIDISATLVGLARERMPADFGTGRVDFRVGDMLDPALGRFDHVVSMDSLIHYAARDVVSALGSLSDRAGFSMLFTFAPSTAALAAMHSVGKLFPRGNKSPAISPVSEKRLLREMRRAPGLADWLPSRTERVASGFYTSQAMELRRI